MNKTYIERFELLGYEINICNSMKEFMEDIKIRCDWNPYNNISFKKYMNDKIAGAHNCISDGIQDPDASIYIKYKDGTTYSYYSALGVEGEFKENGIEWALIADGYGYTTYKNDLSAEWEFLELDEDEEKAIELGTSVENYKISKALQAEKQAEEQTEEHETEQEQTEEQKQEQIPSEILFSPSDFLAKPKYKIDILEALKEAGFNSGYIRKNKIFPESTLQKFRTGNTDVSINTIFRVCQILNKDISEIITFRKE